MNSDTGRPILKPLQPRQTIYTDRNGYRYRPRISEHVLVVEKMLGCRIPNGAQVRHRDGDKLNNTPCNLIICEDAAMHARIHKMQKALDACGHADWVRCVKCKRYSPVRKMWEKKNGYLHPLCKHLGTKRARRDPQIYGLD